MVSVPKTETRPRCVVLPIPSQNSRLPALGLAVHFLLGNVLVLHPGFREFWFGWRVSKIFPDRDDLSAYGRSGAPSPDPMRLGRREDIRFWITGSLSADPARPAVSLSMTDAEAGSTRQAPPMVIDTGNHLTGFRRVFSDWLETCGHPMPGAQLRKALWPEQATPAGLDAVGSALEAFYLQSAFGGKAPVALSPFEHAVEIAPSAFMSHDLLGWALYRNRRYDAARLAFHRSVQINSHGAGAMAGLMWCAVMTQDREDALQWAVRKAESCAADAGAAREKAVRLLEKYQAG